MTRTLLDIVTDLDRLDETLTIYACPPWTPASTAFLAPEPDDGSLPPEAAAAAATYFLDVFFARDFVDDLRLGPAGAPPIGELCERLIRHVVTDA